MPFDINTNFHILYAGQRSASQLYWTRSSWSTLENIVPTRETTLSCAVTMSWLNFLSILNSTCVSTRQENGWNNHHLSNSLIRVIIFPLYLMGSKLFISRITHNLAFKPLVTLVFHPDRWTLVAETDWSIIIEGTHQGFPNQQVLCQMPITSQKGPIRHYSFASRGSILQFTMNMYINGGTHFQFYGTHTDSSPWTHKEEMILKFWLTVSKPLCGRRSQ